MKQDILQRITSLHQVSYRVMLGSGVGSGFGSVRIWGLFGSGWIWGWIWGLDLGSDQMVWIWLDLGSGSGVGVWICWIWGRTKSTC